MLDVIEEEQLFERAEAIGARIEERLRFMERRNDLVPIAAIRRLGAMIGFEIVKERGSFEPDAATTKQVTTKALEQRPRAAVLRHQLQRHPHPGAADRQRRDPRRGLGCWRRA